LTRLSTEVTRGADVAAERASVWAVLADLDGYEQLIPSMLEHRQVDGAWRWRLSARSGLGYRFEPTFRVTYELVPLTEVRFTTVPEEHTRAVGRFALSDAGATGTHVDVHIELSVDVPLPSLLAGPAVGLVRDELDDIASGLLKNLATMAR
jgi:carbon monoxide dehydrogenase subunit G